MKKNRVTNRMRGWRVAAVLALIGMTGGLIPAGWSQAKTMPTSGTCGENATFTISDDMTMTISGTGEVEDIDLNEDESDDIYDTKNAEKIKKIVVEEGITGLSGRLFYHYSYVTQISLPETLTSIGIKCFEDCRRLKQVEIPAKVTEAEGIFDGNDDLRKVVNHSAVNIDVNWRDSGLSWYVDKEKTTLVPSGKTAKATPKKYKISYKLEGGKMKGKKVKTYTYGMTPTKLPSAKKKGYIFTGWTNQDEVFEYYRDSISGQYGNITLRALYEKISIKNCKKRKIKIKWQTPSDSVLDYAASCYIRIADNKAMKNASQYICDNWKNRGMNPKNATYKNSKKEGIFTLKKLQKGKTYYVQVGYYYKDFSFSTICEPFMTKKIKIKK